MKHWTLTGRERVFETNWFQLREDRLVSPRNGLEAPFYVMEVADWVNVVALTPARELVLVRQYRFGRERLSLEIPGGVIEPGEDPALAAVRELREETGYAGDPIEPLGWIEPNPALQSNRMFTYVVENCRRVDEPQLDEAEDITVELMPLARLPEAMANGEIRHALALAALFQHHLRGG